MQIPTDARHYAYRAPAFMDMLYAAIEERLKEAINAYNTCKKPNKSANGRESHAPYERLLDLSSNWYLKSFSTLLFNPRVCFSNGPLAFVRPDV